MAETTIILGDWNSDVPAAPAGRENILFAVDRTGAIPKFSASIPIGSDPSLATFIVGIGGAVAAADDVAPLYCVKIAGTITKFTARAKTALAADAVFMIQRLRHDSPETIVDILSGDLTVPDGSIALVETTSFANDDLEVGDELKLNVVSGSPQEVILELHWS